MSKPGAVPTKCAFNGTGKEKFVIYCFDIFKYWSWISTVNKWIVSSEHLARNGQNWPTRGIKCSIKVKAGCLSCPLSPQSSKVTKQIPWVFGYEVLLHPPNSLDLAPSDYHLFLSMANDLAGEKLTSREACENRLSQFFANRDKSFYERGIMKLPSKWQQVIEQNGAYLT